MEHTGLRERSKARRREAIVRAAMELFAERGYDATTVADIAAAAEVAPRTVAMYFPSKQDIAMSRFSEVVGTLTDALRHRGPDERVTEIVQRWLRAGETGEDGELKELAVRMYAVNPELDALRTARMAEAITAGAEAVAAERRPAAGRARAADRGGGRGGGADRADRYPGRRGTGPGRRGGPALPAGRRRDAEVIVALGTVIAKGLGAYMTLNPSRSWAAATRGRRNITCGLGRGGRSMWTGRRGGLVSGLHPASRIRKAP